MQTRCPRYEQIRSSRAPALLWAIPALLCLLSLLMGCDDESLSPTEQGESDLGGPDEGRQEPPRCGDGRQDPGETCDEGDRNGAYGHCAADCLGQGPRCGDGQVVLGREACDDGEDNGSYGACAQDCAGLGPRCGDGRVQAAQEVCDDGPENGEYGRCARGCQGPGPRCGDGQVQAPQEVCDEGAENGRYGGACDEECQGPGPSCGDGRVQGEQEACDEGEENGGYGRCTASCQEPSFPPPAGPLGHVDPGWLDEPPACESSDWLAKYLHYRRRLRGDGTGAQPGFVSVGPDAGQSMPSSYRDPTAECAEDWWVNDSDCPAPESPDARGYLSWGDGTVWLGEYIAVLATEHRAFELLGLDTTQSAQDLRWALAALDRVDAAAELRYGVEPELDGFFLRDDVPQGFERSPDGSYRFPRSEEGLAGYECVRAAGACGEASVEDGYFTSQDQVIGLIYGLALVARLVPERLRVDGEPLVEQARGQVHRMVWGLRAGGWRVTDPLGDHPPDQWGGNAIGFSDEMAKAANEVCGDRFGVEDYRDESSRTMGEAIFAGLLAIWPVTHAYNRTMALRLRAVHGGWEPEEMAARAMHDSKETFALAHAVLHDEALGSAIPGWRVPSLLDSAPCGGPCRNTEGCENRSPWRGESRFVSPGARSGSRHRQVGEFNGMDYMLLHNLYLIHTAGRTGFQLPEAPAQGCANWVDLDALARDGASTGQRWDPSDPCAAADLRRRYCGRSFAAWLDASYRGEATIWAGGARWTCEAGAACALRVEPGVGGPGSDLMLGGDGDDQLWGGEGHDCLYGGAGDDSLFGGPGLDELDGGPGDDVLNGETPQLEVEGGPDVLRGGPGRDELSGGPDGDELYGGPGDDLLEGGGGDDFLEGGEGRDHLLGQAGEDSLHGGDDADRLEGGGGEDSLWGGPGDDKLRGDGDDDWIWGEEGGDLIFGDGGDDRLFSGPGGHDRLCGGAGDDELWGGWDGDECRGGQGLLGGADNRVQGCDDGSAVEDACEDEIFEEAWEPR